LAAGEQSEDDEQRVEPERTAHDIRDDDMPLELLDPEEEERHPDGRQRILDERVEHRRYGAEPWADVRDELRDPGPTPNAAADFPPWGKRPTRSRMYSPSPTLTPTMSERKS